MSLPLGCVTYKVQLQDAGGIIEIRSIMVAMIGHDSRSEQTCNDQDVDELV